MKSIASLLLIFITCFSYAQTEKVTIQGTVTDYEGKPIDSANVLILDESFRQPLYQTVSDANGKYNLEVEKGNYYGMAVVNMNHYGKSRLEYWAWNVPAQHDLEINPRYDKMEVYALNAFRPQGAHPSYIIYFRPMSLTKALEKRKSGDQDAKIAPELDKSEVEVEINDEKVEIYSLQKVKEYAETKDGDADFMYAYLVQTSLPGKFSDKHQKFRVVLKDKETGDKGEAIYFLNKINYIDN
jgi:hypothetical protein